jgi:hypothetical protein
LYERERREAARKSTASSSTSPDSGPDSGQASELILSERLWNCSGAMKFGIANALRA